jgi:putative tricarboxylic transport membrane protein
MAAIRPAWLHAGILVLASVGAWTLHRSAADLVVLAALGTLAFLWRVVGCPTVPVVIGAILGPLAEQHLQRALAVADGSVLAVLRRPVTASLLAVAALVALAAALARRRARRAGV